MVVLFALSLAHAQSTWEPGSSSTVLSSETEASTPSGWREASETLTAGTAMVVVGGILGVTTYSMGKKRQGDPSVDPGIPLFLTLTNVSSWTVAGSGAALLGVGIIHGVSVSGKGSASSAALGIGPDGIRLTGTF